MVRIIVLAVILGVILLIWLLLRCSITLSLAFESSEKEIISPSQNADKVFQQAVGDGWLEIRVKYLFFTVFPFRKKEKKPQKPKKPKRKSPKNVEPQPTEQPTETTQKKVSEPTEQSESEEKPKPKSSEDACEEKEKTPLKEKLADLKAKWNMIKPYLPLAKKSFRRLLKLIRFYDLEVYINSADKDAYEAAMKFGKTNAVVYNALALLMEIFTVKVKKTQISCKFNSDKTDIAVKLSVKIRPSTALRIAISTAFSALRIMLKQRKEANSQEEKPTEILETEM